MSSTTSFISAAASLQELGIIGFLGLSNILWFFVAKMLWQKYQEKEKLLHDCLEKK